MVANLCRLELGVFRPLAAGIRAELRLRDSGEPFAAGRLRAVVPGRFAKGSDGYWIDLKPGFVVPGDAHGIVENTKREARAKLAIVVPCDCAECKRLQRPERGCTQEPKP